jgi:MoaA/NifB/PqqE/SkfB family radical SAM enzyme
MPRPLTLLIDVTDRCNLRCVMCHFANVDRIGFPPFDLPHGAMAVELFEKIAADFFPHAKEVGLACAAEPLMHPRFAEIIAIAGRHRVPRLWFPTNLLALTDRVADAIAMHVHTVAVSIDATTKETYEKIRNGARWDLLLSKLKMLRDVELRFCFTWMRSNRRELRDLPAFAADHGASELDVRMVAPTDGVDVSPELLSNESQAVLRAELAVVARDAVRRGLRLAAFPQFDERPPGLLDRAVWRFWRIRAGLDRLEHLGIARHEREVGCRYPDRNYVIRPTGAVFPCHYFEKPLGLAGREPMLTIANRVKPITDGLRCGSPIGACATCGNRKDALYTV